MSKRTISRWYIGAWGVWFLALVALAVMSRIPQVGNEWSPEMMAALVVMLIAGIVTSVMWGAALVQLASQDATGLFVSIVILQVVGLGIVGMVVYALAGTEDDAHYVIRPSVT